MKISYQYIRKTYILFSMMIIFVLTACTSSYELGNENIEDFGKTILNALKTNDHELFKKYVYSKHEIEYLIKTDSTKKRYEDDMYKRWEEYYPRLIKTDSIIKQEASQEGLSDWTQVEFSKITYKTRSRDPLQARKVILEFTNGNFIGSIRLRTINKSDRGWFMAGMPEFGSYKRFK